MARQYQARARRVQVLQVTVTADRSVLSRTCTSSSIVSRMPSKSSGAFAG
jgi:hypothetical protein